MNEQEFETIIDIFEEKLARKQNVYVEIEGNWIELQFEDVFVCINIWNNIVSFYDPDENEEIARFE
jgi:hypothetical protein